MVTSSRSPPRKDSLKQVFRKESFPLDTQEAFPAPPDTLPSSLLGRVTEASSGIEDFLFAKDPSERPESWALNVERGDLDLWGERDLRNEF